MTTLSNPTFTVHRAMMTLGAGHRDALIRHFPHQDDTTLLSLGDMATLTDLKTTLLCLSAIDSSYHQGRVFVSMILPFIKHLSAWLSDPVTKNLTLHMLELWSQGHDTIQLELLLTLVDNQMNLNIEYYKRRVDADLDTMRMEMSIERQLDSAFEIALTPIPHRTYVERIILNAMMYKIIDLVLNSTALGWNAYQFINTFSVRLYKLSDRDTDYDSIFQKILQDIITLYPPVYHGVNTVSVES